MRIPRLHVVTTDEVVARAEFLEAAGAIMHRLGADGALHLRAPRAAGANVLRLAMALVPMQSASGAWLVINDRVDVALACGAAGVQLTGGSLLPGDARRIAGRLRIGASVHDEDEARSAARDGADWIVAGHVFDTPTHPGAPGRGLAFLDAAVAAGVPTIAIGGIRPHHVPILARHGAHGVAVIRGIWDAENAERAAAEYLSAYDDADSESSPEVR